MENPAELTIFAAPGSQDGPAAKVALPDAIGPRYAFVRNDGRVILVDDWVRRINTERAIVVYCVDGSLETSVSTTALFSAAGQSRGAIMRHASEGAWLAAPPRLTDDGSIIVRIGEASVLFDPMAPDQLIKRRD